ncbi:hypothetical protein [Sphingomonas sp.]|uniref:hypothetical protein n=1 Tax=Sphingomonas sp. TaxID=28214 RepID=UPI003CC6076C
MPTSSRPFLTHARRTAPWFAPTLALIGLSSPAHATGVKAGTMIRNTATASFDNGSGTAVTITSNTVEFRVDEVIDVAVAARDAGDAAAQAGATGQVRTFTVTNAGNGPEAFRLTGAGTVSGNGFDPAVTALVLDSNGDGIYEPGVDAAVAADGSISALEPDAAVTVFVISTIPASAPDGGRGAVALSAVSLTGSGAPGTVFAGQGSGGGDAIIGATHATAVGQGGFTIQRATVSLVKSATVLDPFGGTRAIPGSLVTYRIDASVAGTGSATGLHVTDTFPVGTSYRPGTLTLDGAALTDAADGDPGTASATGIDAALGTQAAGQSHSVRFTVIVN